MKFFPLVFMCLLTGYAYAQQNGSAGFSLQISGEVTKPLAIYADDLSGMKQTTVHLRERDGKDYAYTGVAIQQLLEMAGVTMGKQVHGNHLARYVLVKSADGYKVVFSLAELDTSFVNRTVILAWESEGKPLPANKGPFRLVVTGEKKPTRSSYQVTGLVIGSVKN